MLVNLSLDSELVTPIILKIKEFLLINGHSKADVERMMGEHRVVDDPLFLIDEEDEEPVQRVEGVSVRIQPRTIRERLVDSAAMQRFTATYDNTLWTDLSITGSIANVQAPPPTRELF